MLPTADKAVVRPVVGGLNSNCAGAEESVAHTLSTEENDEVSTLDSNFRFVGYTRSLARLFSYFAFTSDVGVAFSPVVSAKIVNAAYFTTLGYCYYRNEGM